MGTNRPSFNENTSWLTYRDILKSEFALSLPESIRESWQEVHGHIVRIDVWEPNRALEGTLILVHGAGGNGRILAPFAQEAAKVGWRVLAPDLPGYGLTEISRKQRLTYEDWPRVISKIANEQEGKVVLLGASMGGLTAVYSALQTRRLSGVIVTTLIDLSEPSIFARSARWEWLGWLSILGMNAMPWIINPIKIPLRLAAPVRAMSANVEVQKYFLKDKYLGRNWLPIGFWRSVLKYKIEKIKLNCPVLLVHPGDDAWTPFELSQKKLSDIETTTHSVELSNGGHLPLEQPAFSELLQHVHNFLKLC